MPVPKPATEEELDDFIVALDDLRVLEDVQEICRSFGSTPREIRGVSRLKHVYQARQAVMVFFRVRYKWSYPAIGKLFGKDHTTVMGAVRKAKYEVRGEENGQAGVIRFTFQRSPDNAETETGVEQAGLRNAEELPRRSGRAFRSLDRRPRR